MRRQVTILITAISAVLIPIYAKSAAPPSLTLNECYTRVKNNYPLIHQMGIIEKTAEFTVSNAAKGYLPRISLTAQANYLSDVTSLPISSPAFSVDPISNDQYKIYGEVYQPLTDFYRIEKQKKEARLAALTDKNSLEVELYKLKERVNGLFFGSLLVSAQIEQTIYLKKDLAVGIQNVEASLANGLASENDKDIILAEILAVEQKLIEWKTVREGYLGMLGNLIGAELDSTTELVTPEVKTLPKKITRPEPVMFEARKQSLEIKKQLLNARLIPSAGLYLQGGFGRPALNMLDDDFTTYYILGLRFNWNIPSFYTSGNEKKILALKQKSLDVQKETFLFNTTLVASSQKKDIQKYQSLLNSDKEIIELRQNIKNRANLRLENGVISANDFIRYVNNEDKARQSAIIHQIQLLMTQYQYQVTVGASK